MIRNKKGFTLIELIIVMAIIGILAVVAVIAIGSKSADARDARRLADMASVRTALALSCSDGQSIALAPGAAAGNSEICNASGSSYITFTNIHDPGAADTTCHVAAHASSDACQITTNLEDCDYAFSLDSAGTALTSGANLVNPCAYFIVFSKEGKVGLSYASEDGLVE